MKVGIFGDAHLTNSLPYTVPGNSFRKEMLVKYIDHFFSEIKEQEVSFLIVPGDLVHSTNLSPDDNDLLFYFYLKVSKLKLPVIISSGNHDIDNEDSALKFLTRVKNKNIFYKDKPVSWSLSFSNSKIAEFNIINFCDHKKFIKHSKKATFKHDNSKKILVGHVGVKGSLHGTTKSIFGVKKEDIEKLHSIYDLIVIGHHHNMQWVTDKCLYPGSIHQTRVDEVDTVPGGVIVDLNKTKATKIENKFSPRFIVVESYKVNPEKIKGSIVKPVIDLESKSEEYNIKFLKRLEKYDPYYLIRPRIKKVFVINKGNKSRFKNKLDAINKTIDDFNLEKKKRMSYKKHTVGIWDDVCKTSI